MNKFNIGDKVRLKSLEEIRKIDKDLYGLDEEDLKGMQGDVYTIYFIDDDDTCKLKGEFCDYWFKLAFFEKVDKFYKTLPNDFSGKLTIEKGQVIEKEEKKEILDEVEKEYLRAVIKPFYKRVINIRKARYFGVEYILINLNADKITLPYFKKGEMYKGMEPNKSYSLQELGL